MTHFFSFFSFSKKLFRFTIVLLLIGSTTISLSAKNDSTVLNNSRTIYVDNGNIDGPWDGSIEHPYIKIEQGVHYASPGDIVYVFNGRYGEEITIDTPDITLKGESKESTIIFSVGVVYCSLIINADNVTVTSMNFQSTHMVDGNIKMIVTSDYCHIYNNTFSDMWPIDCREGVILEGANYTTFERNNFACPSGAGQIASAISLNNSFNNNILYNDFGGLYAFSIVFWDSGKNTVLGNEIGNLFTLVDSSDNMITMNSFGSYRGMYFENSSNNSIINNNFGKHGFKQQRKVGNQIIIVDSDNLFDQNYWGRSRLFPKVLFGMNGTKHVIEVDWHPAKTPNTIS